MTKAQIIGNATLRQLRFILFLVAINGIGVVNAHAADKAKGGIVSGQSKLQKAALKAAADQLKDPDSAKFRNVRYFTVGKGINACGEINAKNSYGGYTGFAPFYVSVRQDGTSDAQILDSNALNEPITSPGFNLANQLKEDIKKQAEAQ